MLIKYSEQLVVTLIPKRKCSGAFSRGADQRSAAQHSKLQREKQKYRRYCILQKYWSVLRRSTYTSEKTTDTCVAV